MGEEGDGRGVEPGGSAVERICVCHDSYACLCICVRISFHLSLCFSAGSSLPVFRYLIDQKRSSLTKEQDSL